MKKTLSVLVGFLTASALGNNYTQTSDLRSLPEDAPLPIYRPGQGEVQAKKYQFEERSQGRSQGIYEKMASTPITLRGGIGGITRNDLPNTSGGYSVGIASEIRFREPFSIVPRFQYSREKAFLGLRERGNLVSTRVDLNDPEDTRFSEFVFGINGAIELTPQDGFFHLITGAGPFYRSATLAETAASMRGRPAFSGSELTARGLGINLNAVASIDIVERYGIFFSGNYDVIVDSTQRFGLKQSEPITEGGPIPGLSGDFVSLLERNSFAWQIGAQIKF